MAGALQAITDTVLALGLAGLTFAGYNLLRVNEQLLRRIERLENRFW